MRTPRYEVEAPVLLFHARDAPSARLFMRDHGLNGEPFDFIVLHHGRDDGRGPFGVRHHPRTAVVLNIGYGTESLPFDLSAPLFEPVIQFVELVLHLLEISS